MIGRRLIEGLCSRAGAPVLLGAAAAAGGLLMFDGIDPIRWGGGLAGSEAGGGALIDGGVITVLLLLLGGLLALGCRVRALSAENASRRAAESGAHALARQDPLTGLPNRRVLKEQIDRALADMWPGLSIAVLLIDLDGFKSVNDIFGHNVGDEVLRIAAARMQAALSFSTVLVRLAGDEFAVLVPFSLQHRAVAEAEAVVAAMQQEFRAGTATVSIGASVGVAFAPADATDTLSLLWAADVAMYRSKEAGGHRATRFESSMGREVRETARFKSELREAIDSGQIVPFYQPLVDLRSGRIVEFEVLARWLHPDQGVVPPDRFIAIVDAERMATPMLDSLLRQVARDAAEWPGYMRFSINLFASQLLESNLVEVLCAAASGGGLAPSRLCLEVTENAQVRDIASARRIMEAARAAGMTLALDDVGTGYSSLHHLRVLPFDRMKIDRSFVQSSATDDGNANYLDVMLTVARKLGLETVAEGIETAELDRTLAGLRCDYGQGYFYSRPVPASDVLPMLARNGSSATVLRLQARSAG